MPALPLSVATVIKKTYKMLENLWETYMLGGKINPVTGIFLAKNQYGYRDQTDVVVAPKNKQTEDFSADEIRERYLPKKDQ